MRVLVACEESGTVRRAFRKAGQDAYSCDLLPSDDPEYHYQCDVFHPDVLGGEAEVGLDDCAPSMHTPSCKRS